MPLRRLSIQWKITLLAGLCLLAIVALLVATSLTQAHRSAALVNQANTAMLEDSARQRLQAHAETQALRIQRYFMDAYQYGNGFARLVHVLKARGGSDLRAELTRQARASLAGNPDVIGLYLVFQPNALDQQDSHYLGQDALGSNESGRFSLYWSQPSPGTLELEAMPETMLGDTSIGSNGAAKNRWLTCPQDTARTCMLEPYLDEVNGRQVLMTSIALPLLEHGKVVGVVGLDIGLANLQQLSVDGRRDLFDGQGQVSIATAAGLLAGNSRDDSTLGKPMANAVADGLLRVAHPFTPIPDTAPWQVWLEVPESVLQAPAVALNQRLDAHNQNANLTSLLIGLGTAIVGLLLVWLTARGVSRPILAVAARLEDIASGEGDLTRRLDYARQDELGLLTGWFNRFLDKLQPVIAQVKGSLQEARDTADQSAAILQLPVELVRHDLGCAVQHDDIVRRACRVSIGRRRGADRHVSTAIAGQAGTLGTAPPVIPGAFGRSDARQPGGGHSMVCFPVIAALEGRSVPTSPDPVIIDARGLMPPEQTS